MPEPRVTLVRVDEDREPFVPLLLEADESIEVLRTYLGSGDLHRIVCDDEPIGVVLLIAEDADGLEIKNIALVEEHRGRGLGAAAIAAIVALAKDRGFHQLVVGTADSSTGTIAFYRSCGFEETGRDAGFFDRYPEPVIEDGVPAHDMVRFAMRL